MSKQNLKQLQIKWKRYIPLCLPISFACAAATLILHIVTKTHPQIADAANRYYGTAVRILTNLLTGWLPFSLAEGLLLFSPVLLFVLIWLAVYLTKKSMRLGVRYLCVLLSVICILYTLFVPALGLGSNTTDLAARLSLNGEAVSAEQLAAAMQWCVDEANALCGSVDFAFGGASSMPFATYDRMCADLMIGYERLHQAYPIFWQFTSSVKPVILSDPMSYTHITGIYTFFTGEANLNVNFPDYTLPFTAAHELAHQRGFAREKEANFIAFLVCIHGENPYTRYSGYLNMAEYLSNALYSADKTLWEETYSKMDPRIRCEMQAYNRFYEKYKDNTAATISNAVNDTYLKVQGQTAGTKSYGLVVDLAVAYYESKILES
ncbi:MAG: DUF3810 domain-containing protein [Clostridia bacterium]|nr:DUF3810 domain-containing protein [Clostridia bacterium]